LDTTKSSLEKIEYFQDEYKDIFDEVEEILNNIELNIEDLNFLNSKLISIYKKSINRVDLFFDSLN
jgi:hypothetical protein